MTIVEFLCGVLDAANLVSRACVGFKTEEGMSEQLLSCQASMAPAPSHLPSSFARCASEMMRRAQESSVAIANRRFRGLFGVSPDICAAIWNKLRMLLPRGAAPAHLLWALLFLKNYSTEHVNSVIAGVDEKTFRKWCWAFVKLISNLGIVSAIRKFFLTGSSLY